MRCCNLQQTTETPIGSDWKACGRQNKGNVNCCFTQSFVTSPIQEFHHHSVTRLVPMQMHRSPSVQSCQLFYRWKVCMVVDSIASAIVLGNASIDVGRLPYDQQGCSRQCLDCACFHKQQHADSCTVKALRSPNLLNIMEGADINP